MSMLQIGAAAPPFDRPAIGVRAARVLSLAEAMGLLQADSPIYRLDADALKQPISELIRRGIGRQVALQINGKLPPGRLAQLLDELYSQLEDSPLPASEAAQLTSILGLDLLSSLTSASASSLRRYASEDRTAPDVVAARLHHLTRINAHLAGGYNDFGIRRWYVRERAQLGGRAPRQILSGPWDPTEEGPRRVLELAESLNSSPTT